jgi:hypothetical protein
MACFRWVFVAVFFNFLSGCEASSQPLVTYYANETVPESAHSENYRELIYLLAQLSPGIGDVPMQRLLIDAKIYAKFVDLDVAALAALSKSMNFTLVAFTNHAALSDQYIFVTASNTEIREIRFSHESPSGSFYYNPLAAVENLKTAIVEAANVSRQSRDIILIVNSHGTRDFAVIPRVAVDFTSMPRSNALQSLRRATGGDLSLSNSHFHGIEKTELFDSIRDIGIR